MEQYDNYFSVFNYVNSKLETENFENTVIVCMNQDCNKEPYIEINYINEDDDQAGLTTNYENLDLIEECAETHSAAFEVFDEYDDVLSVVYDTGTEQLNLIKIRNGNCIGKKLQEDFEGNAIFLGYIINPKSNLVYKEKITLLYEIMKKIMCNAYDYDLEHSIIFKVKNNLTNEEDVINNIYITRNFKEGCSTNDNKDISDQQNYEVIESIYDVKFNEENIEKVKKYV